MIAIGKVNLRGIFDNVATVVVVVVTVAVAVTVAATVAAKFTISATVESTWAATVISKSAPQIFAEIIGIQ